MSETLLDYAINTTPDPLQASPATGNPNQASLVLVVSNSSGDNITCKSITLSFRIGTNAEDLCSDPTGISSSIPSGWKVNQQGGQFTFQPDTAKDGQIGGSGLSFRLSGINVNQQPGTTQVTITEDASDSDAFPPAPEQDRYLYLPLTKFPQHFTVGELSANPSIVNAGESTVLSWSGSGSSGNYNALYEIEYVDGDGNKVTISHVKGEPTQPLPPTGNYTVDGLETNPTTFYLIVTVQVQGLNNPLLYTRALPVTVIQPKPVINCFSIAANPIVPNQNLSFTLTWDVANVNDFQVLANDGPNGQSRRLDVPFSLKGSYAVYPHQLQTTYTMELLTDKQQVQAKS